MAANSSRGIAHLDTEDMGIRRRALVPEPRLTESHLLQHGVQLLRCHRLQRSGADVEEVACPSLQGKRSIGLPIVGYPDVSGDSLSAPDYVSPGV